MNAASMTICFSQKNEVLQLQDCTPFVLNQNNTVFVHSLKIKTL